MVDYSDTDLVKQFRKGNDEAFSVLVRRHQDKIYRLACLNLYHQQDAMDVTQEVFMRAYRGLRKFRFQSEPFSWLYRTVKNVCHEFNKKATRDSVLSSEYTEELNNLTDNSNPETRQYLEEIRQLIKTLPARQHEVVTLRIFEGFTIAETAKIMNCRPGTVKALLHKAQKQIHAFEDFDS